MSDEQPTPPDAGPSSEVAGDVSTAPPHLAIASVILWYLLAGLCGVIALLMLTSIGFGKPGPVIFALVGLVAFPVEARSVWKGRRSDVLYSALGSLGLAAAWWLIGSGQSRGFAYVPPVMMIAAGLGVLASRSEYLRWRTQLKALGRVK